ncbi:MAG: aldehyde dehydrogenase [Elusimicrobiales bacterium]|nr:aldehyde dehydrogenase [Elusimicrobiales bacterium]
MQNIRFLSGILQKQRDFFAGGATLDISFRIESLKKLRKSITENEEDIISALHEDLGKGPFESYMCEIGMAISEIDFMIKNIKKFSGEKDVPTPMANFPARSYVKPSPLGNVLIISPWNYPFLLAAEPLADAIAAGNTAMIKPSKNAPATAKAMGKIIRQCFPEEYVYVEDKDIDAARELAKEKFDLIFFTGSSSAGKEIYRQAAENLTPVILELGGKSPCIVDSTANIKLAARRIVFGKFLNCGQTCVAPDYVLCQRDIADKLKKAIISQIKTQYGENPMCSPDYGRIINQKHFDRIVSLIDAEKLICGGNYDREMLKIEPTVLDRVTWQDKIMQEEIFGPVLPVLIFDDIKEILSMLKDKPRPLALYVFSGNRKNISLIMEKCRFGGGCINDTVIHLAGSEMGFGGVGESGTGAYHGEAGFRAFSHFKSIADRKTWPDFPARYAPHKPAWLKFLRKIMG